MGNQKLSPIPGLFKNSLSIYFKKDNLVYILKFMLVNLGLITLFMGLMIVFISGMGYLSGIFQIPTFVSLILLVVFALVATFYTVWLQAATIIAVSSIYRYQVFGIKETFIKALPFVWRYLVTLSAVTLAVLLGLILLFIPGIVVAVWLSMAGFLVVSGNMGVIESLKKSKDLVRGFFWPVLTRLVMIILVSGLIQTLLSFIPYAGGIISIFVFPYFVLLQFMVYQELMKVKGSVPPAPQVAPGEGY